MLQKQHGTGSVQDTTLISSICQVHWWRWKWIFWARIVKALLRYHLRIIEKPSHIQLVFLCEWGQEIGLQYTTTWFLELQAAKIEGFPNRTGCNTYLSSSQALLELRLSQGTMLAVVGLPSYFSPVTGPVVWTTKARHDPLAWNRWQNFLWFGFYWKNYSLQVTWESNVWHTIIEIIVRRLFLSYKSSGAMHGLLPTK